MVTIVQVIRGIEVFQVSHEDKEVQVVVLDLLLVHDFFQTCL